MIWKNKKEFFLKNFLLLKLKKEVIFLLKKVARLALVKPEKAKKIEDIIIQSATAGKISTKLDESAIIAYLDQLTELESKEQIKLTFKRKVNNDEDDYGIDENL